jgi:predicted SnoaL-like aldol condensation-catalyzing enzyme
MKIVVRGLAAIGAVALVVAVVVLVNLFSGPSACAIGGAPIQFAEPASASTANRDLVLRFYSDVLFGGRLDRAGDFLRPDYIQHNPRVRQGLQGFVEYFTKLNASLKDRGMKRQSELTMALAEGDLVAVHTTTVIEGRTTASFRAMDLFRIQDGKIAEHWDTIQPCDKRSALLLALAG